MKKLFEDRKCDLYKAIMIKRYFDIVKHNRINAIIAFVISFFLGTGVVYRVRGAFFSFLPLLAVLICALMATPFVCKCLIFVHSNKRIFCEQKKNARSTIKVVLCITAILFICQIPFFLAFYPGICTYDLPTQVEQYNTGDFYANHPLVHTLYLGIIKDIVGEPNRGYAVTNIIQMIVLDMIVAYMIVWIDDKIDKKWVRNLLVIIYAINPIMIFMSMSATKDTLFTAFFVLTVILTMRIIDNNKRILFIAMALSTVMMMLFRNNAIYAYVPAFIITLLLIKKNRRLFLSIMLCAGVSLILYFGINRLLVKSLDATPTSIKEMMSIPAQSDGRIYLLSNDEDDKNTVLEYISQPAKYERYISDPMKSRLSFDVFDSKCKHFLLDSAILALKNPICFIDSTMLLIQGYWDILDSPYQYERYFLAPYSYKADAVLDSKIIWLRDICQKYLYNTTLFKNSPVIILLNNAIYIWVIIYCLARGIFEKDTSKVVLTVLPLCYLMTLLLGPAAITRYAFPFILLAPVSLIYALSEQRVTEEINEE